MEINGSVKTKGSKDYRELGKRLEELSLKYLKEREKRREVEKEVLEVMREAVENREDKALRLFSHYFLIKNVETSDEFLRDVSNILGEKGIKTIKKELEKLGKEDRRIIWGLKKKQIINFLIYSSLKAPNKIKEVDNIIISLFGNEDRLVYEYYRKLFVEARRSTNTKEVEKEVVNAIASRIKHYLNEKNYSRAYRIITLFKKHFPLSNSLKLERLEDMFIKNLRKVNSEDKEFRNAKYFFSKYRKDFLSLDPFNKKLREVGKEKFPSLFRKKTRI